MGRIRQSFRRLAPGRSRHPDTGRGLRPRTGTVSPFRSRRTHMHVGRDRISSMGVDPPQVPEYIAAIAVGRVRARRLKYGHGSPKREDPVSDPGPRPGGGPNRGSRQADSGPIPVRSAAPRPVLGDDFRRPSTNHRHSPIAAWIRCRVRQHVSRTVPGPARGPAAGRRMEAAAPGFASLEPLSLHAHPTRLFRLAPAIVDERAEAQDIVQDAWVRYLEPAEDGRAPPGSSGPEGGDEDPPARDVAPAAAVGVADASGGLPRRPHPPIHRLWADGPRSGGSTRLGSGQSAGGRSADGCRLTPLRPAAILRRGRPRVRTDAIGRRQQAPRGAHPRPRSPGPLSQAGAGGEERPRVAACHARGLSLRNASRKAAGSKRTEDAKTPWQA